MLRSPVSVQTSPGWFADNGPVSATNTPGRSSQRIRAVLWLTAPARDAPGRRGCRARRFHRGRGGRGSLPCTGNAAAASLSTNLGDGADVPDRAADRTRQTVVIAL